jgi:hypothetical protein
MPGRETRNMSRIPIVLLLLLAAVRAGTDPVEKVPTAVRPLRGWIAKVIADARPLSPTLDSQLRQVAALRLIVYVDDLSDRHAPYDGRLSFVGAAGGYRFLRIELRHLPGASTAAVLAHELQHVLEVAASEVRTRPEFEALYRSIGVVDAGSDGRRYDTAAAVASGMAAMRELAGAAGTYRER